MSNTPHFLSRQLSGTQLAEALRDSRQRTLALVDDLTAAQWSPVHQIGINPIAWELAHIAWFAEFWILRGPHSRDANGFAHAQHPPQFAGPDALFDSARLAHAQRWVETMPSRAELRLILQGQLDACIQAIPNTGDQPTTAHPGAASQDPLYFHRLALFHEDMHCEAFCWMRAALAYPTPQGVAVPCVGARALLRVPGADVRIGCDESGNAFAFDNECPAHTIHLGSYAIDSAPVRAMDFAEFVDAGGYAAAQYWPAEAGAWRAQCGAQHPLRWRRGAKGAWEMRWFDQWLPLSPDMPALNINAFEAQAYCLWAGRRLPSAAEWEHAALTQPGFYWGHSVWEWTADAFAPYPGFVTGPYREYSQPWFGNHRELRGGAFATHARMHHPRYRNFFQPHRSHVFAGFRTVAEHSS